MIAKLGLRTYVLRVVASSWLCASCGESADRSDEGRTQQASRASPPVSEPETDGRADAPETDQLAPALSGSAPGPNDENGGARASAPTDPSADPSIVADPRHEDGGASMPARPPESTSDAAPAADGDGLTCYPLLAHNGDNQTPYAVGVATDAYVAFTFAAPWRDTSYAVTFRPVIDNSQVVHHWLLYQDNSAGTPGGAVQEIVGVHPDAQLISAWTPGTDPLDFRSRGLDVGLELPSDTTYTLEFHYNSRDPAATDRSGVEVCTSNDKPAHSAGYSWLGYENWLVPSASWTGTCAPSASEPIRILAILPHMHYKGRHMKATLRRADGSEEAFHDHDFDFNYETLYPVDVILQPGDSVITTCTYSEPATYGPGVTDEMCYMFTVAYPRGALVSPDLAGGIIHGGTSCFGQ